MSTALSSTTTNGNPHTYQKALLRRQKKWDAEIIDNYDSILRNETFAPAVFGKKPMESTYVIKTKRHPSLST
jgi:hypothetical protein